MKQKWTQDGLTNFIGESQANGKQIDLKNGLLKGLDLTGIDLSGSFLEEADFSNCILEGAKLRGIHAKKAVFDGANLNGADLSSMNGKFSSYQTDLTGASMKQICAKGIKFFKVRFWHTDLFQSDLSYADFSHSSMDAFTNFSRCDLRHSNWKSVALGRVDFYQANIWDSLNVSSEISQEYISQMKKTINFRKSTMAV
jgi:uncharacterized protein YjbI with pentapeptide repeats